MRNSIWLTRLAGWRGCTGFANPLFWILPTQNVGNGNDEKGGRTFSFRIQTHLHRAGLVFVDLFYFYFIKIFLQSFLNLTHIQSHNCRLAVLPIIISVIISIPEFPLNHAFLEIDNTMGWGVLEDRYLIAPPGTVNLAATESTGTSTTEP